MGTINWDGGVITITHGKLPAEDIERLRVAFEEKHKGPAPAGKILTIPATGIIHYIPATYEPLGILECLEIGEPVIIDIEPADDCDTPAIVKRED